MVDPSDIHGKPLDSEGGDDFKFEEPAVYPQIRNGLHQAVIVDVENLGVVKTKFGDKKRVRIVVQTKARIEAGPDVPAGAVGKRYELRRDFTNTLHEKGALLPLVKAACPDVDPRKVHPMSLIGQNVMVQTELTPTTDGRLFANAMGYVSLPDGLEPIKPEGYVRREKKAA